MIRLATYNIHGAVGRDGACRPQRIRDVIAEIAPDVIALQEVDSCAGGVDLFAWLAAEMGLTAVAGATRSRGDGRYGNLLLARCPIRHSELLDLTWSRREPRGAISADVDCGTSNLHVVVTHFGLRPAERRAQAERLLQLFTERADDPAVLAGDLNEWFLWGRPLRRLRHHFDHAPSPATFPSQLPVFALDRIYVRPRSLLRSLAVHDTPLAREASDHLPVVATLNLQ